MALDITRTRTSRGRVKCDFCLRTIARGTRYTELATLEDGSAYSTRTCPACEDAYEWASWNDFDRSWEFGLSDPFGDTADTVQEWSEDQIDVDLHYVKTLVFLVTHERLDERHTIRYALDVLKEEQDRAARLDRSPEGAWDAEQWAAFTWRMRTSPAMHPQGVKE